ncbi:MAG: Trk system potassium transporter TrkA [Deltaproteobacteria bacterium]|nr:Trk system potassium transporter TrkA [Deltaproteobacteria bacterium]
MKIIIVGAGEVGFHSAQKLSEENQDVVLIDKDPEKIKRITENLDVQAILGSGTSPGMLKSAGISEANMLVAATDSDEVNLIACLLARSLNKYIVKVARVRNSEYLEEEGLFSQDLLGIDQIINPEVEMVQTIRNLMLVPGASDMIDFLDGRIKLVGHTIKADSPFVNRQLQSFRELGGKVLMGAIVRGEEVFIPHGKDTLQANDLVYVVVRTNELSDLFQFLGVKDEALNRVIIVGGGATGTALALSLDKTRLNVKLIEKNSTRCNELVEKLEHVIVINGDGTDKDLLQEENIREVDFMVAITGDEESNVLISLLAKGLGAKKTIARINKSSYIPLVSAIGIDIVVTLRLSAVRAILQYIRRGKIISVAPLKGEHAEVIDAEALETSDIVHKPISELKFPKGALIGAIARGDETFIPHGESVIEPKDRLIIFALHKVIPKLEKMLTVKLDYF